MDAEEAEEPIEADFEGSPYPSSLNHCEEKEVGEIVGYLPQVELEKMVGEISNGAHACLANTPLKR